MAIKARKSKILPIMYIPQEEEGSDNPTQFKLKPLDGLEYMDVLLHAKVNSEGEVELEPAGLKVALKFGLIGSKNLTDELGNVDVELIPTELDSVLLIELAKKIMEISNVSDEERKNS